MRGHVIGALQRVGPEGVRPPGTTTLNQDSKSRRTSGEAFSCSVKDAEVCWISRCSIPTRSSASPGSARSTSDVTR